MKLATIIRRFVDPLKPVVRTALPNGAVEKLRPVYRWLQDRRILQEPDRLFMSERIVPGLAAEGARIVLFVGTRSYTRATLAQLDKAGIRVWTSDIDPVAARYGQPGRHVVMDVCQMDDMTIPDDLDSVMMNGVLGYGVDSPEQCHAALAAAGRMLPPNGRLVLGWNTDRCPNVGAIAQAQHFRADPLPGTLAHQTFDGSTHVYDFFRRI